MKLNGILLTLLFLLLMATATNIQALQQENQYIYSDFLSKDKDLAWEIKKMEGYDNFVLFNNVSLKKGDVVKLTLLKDLDRLQLSDEIWNYSVEKWAELYVNDILKPIKPYELIFNNSFMGTEYGMFLTFITPIQIINSGKTVLYYDMLYDSLQKNEFTNSTDSLEEYFVVDYTKSYFIMTYHYKIKDTTKFALIENAILAYELTIMYDISTGVLIEFDVDSQIYSLSGPTSRRLVFRSTTAGLAISLQTGIVLISFMLLIIIVMIVFMAKKL